MKKSNSPKKTPPRIGLTIKFDPIDPRDYEKYNLPWSCEDCTHFNEELETCTLGYESKWHRREFQKQSYLLSGKTSVCRFQEID